MTLGITKDKERTRMARKNTNIIVNQKYLNKQNQNTKLK